MTVINNKKMYKKLVVIINRIISIQNVNCNCYKCITTIINIKLNMINIIMTITI